MRRIRVLLLRDVSVFELAITSKYRVTDAQGRTLWSSAGPLPRSRAKVGPWKPLQLELAGRAYRARELRIVPETSGALELMVGFGGQARGLRRYRGELRVHLADDGTADVVNALDMEQYLGGVLRGELYPSFHYETYRAQAVAARTYALYSKYTSPAGRHWDVQATESSQVYIGVAGETKQALRAVNDTYGQVCCWHTSSGPRIFATYYSSTCGGMTQDAANVWPFERFPRPDTLRGGVSCHYCSKSKYYRWPAVRISKVDLTSRLVARYDHLAGIGPVQRVEVIERTRRGRPKRVRIVGRSGGDTTLRSEDLRLVVGASVVKSTHCRITDGGDHVLFSDGRGYGHGVGMCQWGAEGLARLGKNAGQILQYYYTGCVFKRAYDNGDGSGGVRLASKNGKRQ